MSEQKAKPERKKSPIGIAKWVHVHKPKQPHQNSRGGVPQYMIDVKKWLAPNIGDVVTSLGLESNLVDSDFEYDQGMYHAPFQRAYNVRYGVIEGDEMQGLWAQLRLSNSSSRFTWISSLYINWLVAQKNF